LQTDAAFNLPAQRKHETQRLNSQSSTAVPSTDTRSDPRQPRRDEKRANICAPRFVCNARDCAVPHFPCHRPHSSYFGGQYFVRWECFVSSTIIGLCCAPPV